MKETYAEIARLVRWAVAGVVSFVMVAPMVTSLSTSI